MGLAVGVGMGEAGVGTNTTGLTTHTAPDGAEVEVHFGPGMLPLVADLLMDDPGPPPGLTPSSLSTSSLLLLCLLHAHVYASSCYSCTGIY